MSVEDKTLQNHSTFFSKICKRRGTYIRLEPLVPDGGKHVVNWSYDGIVNMMGISTKNLQWLSGVICAGLQNVPFPFFRLDLTFSPTPAAGWFAC
jgi:hypothetical protein